MCNAHLDGLGSAGDIAPKFITSLDRDAHIYHRFRRVVWCGRAALLTIIGNPECPCDDQKETGGITRTGRAETFYECDHARRRIIAVGSLWEMTMSYYTVLQPHRHTDLTFSWIMNEPGPALAFGCAGSLGIDCCQHRRNHSDIVRPGNLTVAVMRPSVLHHNMHTHMFVISSQRDV